MRADSSAHGSALATTTSCAPAWLPLNNQEPGTGVGSVNALTVFDDGSGPALYVGGSFPFAGGAEATCIAKWDGGTWSPVGKGIWKSSSSRNVAALAVFDDGNGPALYAGGDFDTADGMPARSIAKWDGLRWAPLGSGVDLTVNALVAFDDGSGPALFVGGTFDDAGGLAASGIAKWDGTTWSLVGGGVDYVVNALAIFDDGTGPALFAAGSFTIAGGVAVNRIAKWDGATWTPLANGLDGTVYALTVFDDGGGLALYAAGAFAAAGGVAANRIAKWDGGTWLPVGSGLSTGFGSNVLDLVVHDDGTGPALYAGGNFVISGVARFLARWDGSTWAPIGTGVSGQVAALGTFDDGHGPSLFAGGSFTTAGGIRVNNIARWSASSWSQLGHGARGFSALAVFDDGSGPALYGGGGFELPGGSVSNGVAQWNGAGWSPLGLGVSGGRLGTIDALTVFDDGSGPALYAGGNFTSMDGVPANNIAKWNGAAWSPLGSGVDETVVTLAVFDDGRGPALYAGGGFRNAGGAPALYLARWDGVAWGSVGGGTDAFVSELLSGSGPALYAAGSFTSAGAVAARGIAKWDGTTWSPLRSGNFDPIYVTALTFFDDGTGPALHAGGGFLTTAGLRQNAVAKWNGTSWAPLGGGFEFGDVFALAAFDDGTGPALYAGGDVLTIAGGPIDEGLLRWDGIAWLPPGGIRFEPWVNDIEVFDDGAGPALYAAGGFFTSPAGDSHIAKWGCSLPAGARSFGISGSGCVAPVTIGVTSPPRVGNVAFAITCANAPRYAPGLFLAGNALQPAVPILGMQISVSPILLPVVLSDGRGRTAVPMPIPAQPALVGLQCAGQFLWLGPSAPPPCPLFGLSASNALELTIQP